MGPGAGGLPGSLEVQGGEAARHASRCGVCEGVLGGLCWALSPGEVIWGVTVWLLHRGSFLPRPAGAGPARQPHPGPERPSLRHQRRPHLQAEGGLHHQSQGCSPGARARPWEHRRLLCEGWPGSHTRKVGIQPPSRQSERQATAEGGRACVGDPQHGRATRGRL